MSNPRRKQSLYADVKIRPFTPDLTLQERIKIVPDTKIERALYKLLLDQMQENSVLKFRIKELRDNKRDGIRKRAITKAIRRALSGPMTAGELGRPAKKGEGL